MKLRHLTTLAFGLAMATLTSCVTTETVTTYPDGRVVKEKTTAPALETVQVVTAAAAIAVDQASGK